MNHLPRLGGGQADARRRRRRQRRSHENNTSWGGRSLLVGGRRVGGGGTRSFSFFYSRDSGALRAGPRDDVYTCCAARQSYTYRGSVWPRNIVHVIGLSRFPRRREVLTERNWTRRASSRVAASCQTPRAKRIDR